MHTNGYNITAGGEGFHCNHSEESKQKIKANRYDNSKDENLNKSRSEKLKGIKHSNERVEAMKAGHEKSKTTKTCKQCNKEFRKNSDSEFCCQLCKIRFYREPPKQRYTIKNCKVCGKTFNSKYSDFCNANCRVKFERAQNKLELE